MKRHDWSSIPFCIDLLRRIQPARVLDVGVGSGRWGVILRELSEDLAEDDGALTIEGVPAEPDAPIPSGVYDVLHPGDAATLLTLADAPWDVVIVDSLPARRVKDDALRLVGLALERAPYVLLVVAVAGAVKDNGTSSARWELRDVAELPVVRQSLVEASDGRLHGAFLLSRADPRGLGVELDGASSVDAVANPGALSGLLTRIQETAFELQYVKAHVTYRLATRIRSTLAWHAFRWLWNRNRGIVTVRALGDKNPRAQGSQVWVLRASLNAGGPSVPWDFVERKGAWYAEPVHDSPYAKCLVADAGRLRIPMENDPELHFLTHPWSGKVEVRFRGRRESFDLYSPEGGRLKVFPARTPMAQVARTSGAPVARGDVRMTPAQEAFVETMRESGETTVSVYCPRWLGVTSSTRILFPHIYPIPDTPAREPYGFDAAEVAHHARVLAEAGVRQIVFSGGDEVHFALMEYLRARDRGLRFSMLWHGSYVQLSEDYHWKMIRRWVDAARDGMVERVGTVKKGMEKFFESLGVRSGLVLNYVPGTPEPPPPIEGEERHLGMWISGDSYRKLPHAMLSAIAMVPNARLHAAGLSARAREVVQYLRIPVGAVQELPLPHAALPQAIRKTHVSLYVTFSECCPMLPLESMAVGVPCLIGPTSHLFEDHAQLADWLVVPFPDRADVIADFVRRAIDDRDAIMAAYTRYIEEYNEKARRSVAEFLA